MYQTAGLERYVAIAVETAEQWRALHSIAELEAFGEVALTSLSSRLTKRDAINAALREWCRGQEPFELARRLQSAGTKNKLKTIVSPMMKTHTPGSPGKWVFAA